MLGAAVMSFLGGLRASSSRVLSSPSRYTPRADLPPPRPSIRSLATGPALPAATSTTVQGADELLEDMRRQAEMAKRMGLQIDLTSISVPVMR